jgi:hypothetical protein
MPVPPFQLNGVLHTSGVDARVVNEERMKVFLKWTSISVFIVAVLLATAITATIGWRPILGPKYRYVSNRKFEATPQRLARGRYLMTSVSACFGCHSEHDWKSHGAPMVPGMEGAGEVMPLPEVPRHGGGAQHHLRCGNRRRGVER